MEKSILLFIFIYIRVLKCHCFSFLKEKNKHFILSRGRFFPFFFQKRNIKQKLITEHGTGSQKHRRCVVHSLPVPPSLWPGKHAIGSVLPISFGRCPPAPQAASGHVHWSREMSLQSPAGGPPHHLMLWECLHTLSCLRQTW